MVQTVCVSSQEQQRVIICKPSKGWQPDRRARLLQTDVLSALDRLAAEGKKFDIIFMDPPYEAGLYTSVLERIAENGLLKAEGYLIAEGSSQIALTIPKGMKILREKVYKTTTLTFLCAEEENV